jgi:hypothetical protein
MMILFTLRDEDPKLQTLIQPPTPTVARSFRTESLEFFFQREEQTDMPVFVVGALVINIRD